MRLITSSLEVSSMRTSGYGAGERSWFQPSGFISDLFVFKPTHNTLSARVRFIFEPSQNADEEEDKKSREIGH